MRKELGEYINRCAICQRIRLLRHVPGAYHTDEVGSHPDYIVDHLQLHYLPRPSTPAMLRMEQRRGPDGRVVSVFYVIMDVLAEAYDILARPHPAPGALWRRVERFV